MSEALIRKKNGTQSKIPSLKLDVTFSVFKKQKDRPVMLNSSESLVLLALILLKFYPLLEPQVGLLLVGEAVFNGQLVFQNNFAITIKFSAKHYSDFWFLTNVYGPCTHEGNKSHSVAQALHIICWGKTGLL